MAQGSETAELYHGTHALIYTLKAIIPGFAFIFAALVTDGALRHKNLAPRVQREFHMDLISNLFTSIHRLYSTHKLVFVLLSYLIFTVLPQDDLFELGSRECTTRPSPIT